MTYIIRLSRSHKWNQPKIERIHNKLNLIQGKDGFKPWIRYNDIPFYESEKKLLV